MIEGVKINIGGVDYVAPPLNFRQIRQLRPVIDKMADATQVSNFSDEQIDNIITIVHAALSRNYPDITKEVLEDALDLGNMAKVIQAIMGVSGFIQGEEQPGEV